MKNAWETLAHAPIAEAILDLRVEPATSLAPQAFADCFLATHPQREEMLEGTAQLRLSKKALETNTTHGLVGFRFWTTERTRLVQARLNGFTVNHLFPYGSWTLLSTDGRELWNRYIACCKPRSVTRIALRYVNRIVVPETESPTSYLNLGVRLGGNLESLVPDRESAYNVQLTFPDSERKAQAIVRSYLEPPRENEGAPHILDIDVFRTGEFAPDSDEVWAILDELRDMKNHLFFAATTDKAKETFR